MCVPVYVMVPSGPIYLKTLYWNDGDDDNAVWSDENIHPFGF